MHVTSDSAQACPQLGSAAFEEAVHLLHMGVDNPACLGTSTGPFGFMTLPAMLPTVASLACASCVAFLGLQAGTGCSGYRQSSTHQAKAKQQHKQAA